MHIYIYIYISLSLSFWSGRSPNYTETQKELKWPRSDSKVTVADHTNVKATQKWPKSDPKVTPDPIFESFLSHFGVTLGWDPASHFWVTFGSLLGRFWGSLLSHSNSFCASVQLGGRPLHKSTSFWSTSVMLQCPSYGCPASGSIDLPYPPMAPPLPLDAAIRRNTSVRQGSFDRA